MEKKISTIDKLLNKLRNAQGKSVVVTGGASGIGRAVAQLFYDVGSNVSIVDFNAETGKSTVQEIQRTSGEGKIQFLLADVTKQEECKAAIEQVKETTGGCDILITSAGIVRPAGENGNTAEEIEQMLSVNLFGSIHFVQAVTPLMKAGGRIVCIGSIAGETLIAGRDGYCASKAALHAWAMTRAPELRKQQIILNVVAPGRVLTELVCGWVSRNENPGAAFRAGCATQSSGTMLLPEEIAEMVFLLASEVYPVAGTVLDLSDGWGRGFQGDITRMPASFETFRAFARDTLGLSGV